MTKDTGEEPMSIDHKIIEKHKEAILKIARANTKKNENGLTVIEKDDPWRNETEWDELYKELENNS